MVKSVGRYDLYRTLGEGAYGKVKYGINRDSGDAVAIKILDKEKIQRQNMGAQIKKEIQIMKMINHKHIIAVKEVFATASKIFIVLELVEGGELFEHLVDRKVLPEDEARFFFHQLIEGLMYCHNQGICHRDLKPENLLLDTQGNLKISDFGLSTLYIGDADAEGQQRAELLHTTCGTPNYVAPEVLESRGYDGKRADVWSIGVILFVLLAGYLPFEEETMPALFSKIKQADFAFPMWFSEKARNLLSGILVPNPAARVTLQDVLLHPWMQGPKICPPDLAQSKNIGKISKNVELNTDQILSALVVQPVSAPNTTQPFAAVALQDISFVEITTSNTKIESSQSQAAAVCLPAESAHREVAQTTANKSTLPSPQNQCCIII